MADIPSSSVHAKLESNEDGNLNNVAGTSSRVVQGEPDAGPTNIIKKEPACDCNLAMGTEPSTGLVIQKADCTSVPHITEEPDEYLNVDDNRLADGDTMISVDKFPCGSAIKEEPASDSPSKVESASEPSSSYAASSSSLPSSSLIQQRPAPAADQPLHQPTTPFWFLQDATMILGINLGIKDYMSDCWNNDRIDKPDWKLIKEAIRNVIHTDICSIHRNPSVDYAVRFRAMVKLTNYHSVSENTPEQIKEQLWASVINSGTESLPQVIAHIRSATNRFERPLDRFFASLVLGFVNGEDALSSSSSSSLPYAEFLKKINGGKTVQEFESMTREANFIVPIAAYHYFRLQKLHHSLASSLDSVSNFIFFQ